MSVIPPRAAPETNTTQTSLDLVEQATLTTASGGETVHCMPQMSKERSYKLQKTPLLCTKEAEMPVNGNNVLGTTASRDDAGALSEQTRETVSAANDGKTVTAADECKVQQMSPEQQEQAAVASDDSGIQQSSSQLPEQGELTKGVDVMTASSNVAVTCGDSSEAVVSSKLPAATVKADSAACNVNDERAARETVPTWLHNNGDERDNSDRSHITSANTNETASVADDDYSGGCTGSRKETGIVPVESVSHDKVDGDCREDTTEASLKEQQLRQIMTLPADLLSHMNPSLPISLSLKHHRHQITVPAANIYQSKSGLRLLLPADSLPLEYVDSRQLMCTLGRSDDASQLQQISISLTLH